MPTIGVGVDAAMCSGPLSPPTNSRLSPTSARSSCRSNSPRSTTRSRSAPSRLRAAVAIRTAASRSDGPELSTIRREVPRAASVVTRSAKKASGHRRNGFPALTWTTITSSAAPTPARSRRVRMRASALASSAISTASRSGSASSRGRPGSASSRSHWFNTECRGRRSRARGTIRVYIQARPRMSYPMRSRAPLAQVSHALRGPPCMSIATSNRSRRSRRTSERSSSSRLAPRLRATTITSSRWGLLITTGAASCSTRYARRPSGYARRSARMTGVVNTTSPISRSLSNRIFTRYAREECSTSNGQCRNAWTSSRRTLDHCILRVEH